MIWLGRNLGESTDKLLELELIKNVKMWLSKEIIYKVKLQFWVSAQRISNCDVFIKRLLQYCKHFRYLGLNLAKDVQCLYSKKLQNFIEGIIENINMKIYYAYES